MNKKISMKCQLPFSCLFQIQKKSKTEQEKTGVKLLYSQSSFQIKKKNTKHDKCLRKSQCL